tara:strand:+ start:13677 stop:15398 length:1722 start_codon:yes stop_codon:yes gene_type:complete
MARIPRAADIGRAIPSDRENINVDFGAGTRALSGALSDVAGTVQKKQLSDRQSAMDDADLEMAIALEKEGRAYDQDADYATIGDRSSKNMQDFLGKASSRITNAEDRQKFADRQKLYIERTNTQLGKVAFSKERDDWRGRIDTQLIEARDGAMLGDMGQFSTLAKRRLDSAVEKGYYGQEEADAMYRTWQSEAATGRLETMPPEQRIEALKQPWADNLPPDTRVKYQRRAEEELLVGKAQSTVDQLMAEPEMTLDDGMAVIEKGVKDPAERVVTESRFKTEWATQEAAKQDAIIKTANEFDLMVDAGQSIEDIATSNREAWEALGPTGRQNLRGRFKEKTSPRSSSDPYALEQIIKLSANGDYRGVKLFIANNGSLLNNSDREQYSTAAEDGLAPEGVTDSQAINALLPGSSYTKTRPKLLPMISSWRNQYIQAQGIKPTPDQRDAELRRMIMDYDRDPEAWIFDGTDPVYDLDQSEQDAALATVHLNQLREGDPENYEATTRYLEGQGMGDISRFEFENAYQSQKTLTSLSKTNPVLYTDIEAYFRSVNVNPTHQQFLNAYSKVLERRSVPK